jgi:DNA-binding HxlR family transcriptional regulator
MLSDMKSYGEFCGMARALDLVGDRWALLVVRELLLGPRRYTDLVEGLPGVGTNVLATRIRELEAAGIIERTRVPAPTPAVLYQLTADGRELRPVLDSLAVWGSRHLTRPTSDEAVEPRWLVLSLAAHLDPAELDEGASFVLDVDGEAFTLAVSGDRVAATNGADPDRTATVAGRLRDFFAAARGQRTASQRLTTTGDRAAANKLVKALTGAMAHVKDKA